MRILVSGATGFVGKNLLPYLEQNGIECTGLSLRGEWKNVNLDEYNAFIHLAGKAHDTANTSTPEAYFTVNTEYTKLLFDEFLNSACRDFIYASSVKAVADTVTGVLYEDAEGEPQTPYGQSKLAAETYMLAKQLPAGKRLFILRPCMIHGPGNKGNLNLLYKVVKRGIPYPLASYDNKRSFLSVKNLCYVIYEILVHNEIKGGVYNVSDDSALSTNALIQIIAEAGGKSARLWKIPKTIIAGLAKAGDTMGLPLNSERLKKLTESYVVSNEKLKAALGIRAMPVSVEAGLKETIKSFE